MCVDASPHLAELATRSVSPFRSSRLSPVCFTLAPRFPCRSYPITAFSKQQHVCLRTPNGEQAGTVAKKTVVYRRGCLSSEWRKAVLRRGVAVVQKGGAGNDDSCPNSSVRRRQMASVRKANRRETNQDDDEESDGKRVQTSANQKGEAPGYDLKCVCAYFAFQAHPKMDD